MRSSVFTKDTSAVGFAPAIFAGTCR